MFPVDALLGRGGKKTPGDLLRETLESCQRCVCAEGAAGAPLSFQRSSSHSDSDIPLPPPHAEPFLFHCSVMVNELEPVFRGLESGGRLAVHFTPVNTHTHPRNTHSCRHASLRGVRVTWDVSEDGRLLSGLFIGWICCHSFRLFSSQFQGKAATVEPWEDTNFHLYKVVDRFGFVQ